MREKRYFIAFVVITAILLFLGTGCKRMVLRIPRPETVSKGKLTVGMDATFPPFEEKRGRKFVGFDVDLAGEIAKRLGLKLEIVDIPWDDLIVGLRARKYDAIISALIVTPEGENEIALSTPYLENNLAICVRKNSSIQSEAELSGKKVGVEFNSEGEKEAQGLKEAGVRIKQIRTYDTILFAFEDLESKVIDALVDDFPVVSYFSRRKKNLKVAFVVRTGQAYCVGVREGNDDLLNAINYALSNIKEDGTYKKICEKWFGEFP